MQTHQGDGAPETETWTQAGGKGTYTFKGKMKRILFMGHRLRGKIR